MALYGRYGDSLNSVEITNGTSIGAGLRLE